MGNRKENENGWAAMGCLFVPDTFIGSCTLATDVASTGADGRQGAGAGGCTLAPDGASTGAEGGRAAAAESREESREEREERLWREEMEAAGLFGELEEQSGGEEDGDSFTVTLPRSNAPSEPAQGMDALTRLWGMATELWYDFKRGKRQWGKLRTTEYTDKWNVGSRPVMHFAEVLLRAYPPTIEDARRMAELLALHRRTLPSRADRQNAITDINELRSMNAGWMPCKPGRPSMGHGDWDEAGAIRYLKGKGYKVMKSVKAAVEY